MVPFDREWSDELLFDYFELSEEERDIILNYDKKYEKTIRLYRSILSEFLKEIMKLKN